MAFNPPMAVNLRESGSRHHPVSGGSLDRRDVPTDAVFTIDELVIYLKLPKSTVYKLAQEGEIPGQKVGRHWRFHRARIDAWLGGEEERPAVRSSRRAPAPRQRNRGDAPHTGNQR